LRTFYKQLQSVSSNCSLAQAEQQNAGPIRRPPNKNQTADL
jgi:hypothetical protein